MAWRLKVKVFAPLTKIYMYILMSGEDREEKRQKLRRGKAFVMPDTEGAYLRKKPTKKAKPSFFKRLFSRNRNTQKNNEKVVPIVESRVSPSSKAKKANTGEYSPRSRTRPVQVDDIGIRLPPPPGPPPRTMRVKRMPDGPPPLPPPSMSRHDAGKRKTLKRKSGKKSRNHRLK
jgi:hypothetical protein